MIAPGDIVRPLSHNPVAMIIVKVGDDKARARWFDDGEKRMANFAIDQLEKILNG